MSDFILIGSKFHFHDPIKELLDISNRVHKKYANSQNNNDLFQLLLYIPSIEVSKIENLLSDISSNNFKSKFQKFGYDSFFDYFNLEKQYPIIQKYPDVKNILIYYFCIYWYLDTKDCCGIYILLRGPGTKKICLLLVIHDIKKTAREVKSGA